MKLFDPWQDTIKLLSGARPRRTTRPGEQFETEAPPQRSPKKRAVDRWCRFRLWFGAKIGGDCLHPTDAQQTPDLTSG